MAYDPNTPAISTEDPSASQPKITANFQELNTFLSVNHESLNDPDQGKHKFVQMPEQVAAPVTAASEGAIYTKENTQTSTTDAYFRTESAGSEFPLSGVKAWCVFNGVNAGTFSIEAGSNVTNITKLASGRWRVNFSITLPNAQYGVITTTSMSDTFAFGGIIGVSTRLTTSVLINQRGFTDIGIDGNPITVMILQ